jgi:Holliday junction resolvase RusA-like endonuclease
MSGIVTPTKIVRFEIPMLPPSVNHYVEHKAQGVHVKSTAAKAWERDWPLFAKGAFVTGKRFKASLIFRLGPKDRGDVDNFNKCVLDCVGKGRMLRTVDGKILSDAWIKKLDVEILDGEADRAAGQRTFIQIEAID